jgi:hypothetical protein
MFERRRIRKAAEEARRQEFLAGVGGIDLLQHNLKPRFAEGLFGADAGKVPPKFLRDQVKMLADSACEKWVAGEETEGRTPQQFADEQLAAFLATVHGMPLAAVARWAERRQERKRPGRSRG